MKRTMSKLSTIIKKRRRTAAPSKLAPVHPSEVLREEFLRPMQLSQNQLGRDLGISPRRINEILHGKRGVTADTALRLAKFFGNSPQFWMGLQSHYDLDLEHDRLADTLKTDVKIFDWARLSPA